MTRSSSSTSLHLSRVEITSLDEPATIRLKADFLLDQRDKVEAYVKTLEGRISSLEHEISLLAEIREFSDDLAMFDRNREVGGKSSSRPAEADLSGVTQAARIVPRVQSDPLIVNSMLSLSNTEIRSEDDSGAILEKLRIEMETASDQAKRLDKLARELYQLADLRSTY